MSPFELAQQVKAVKGQMKYHQAALNGLAVVLEVCRDQCPHKDTTRAWLTIETGTSTRTRHSEAWIDTCKLCGHVTHSLSQP